MSQPPYPPQGAPDPAGGGPADDGSWTPGHGAGPGPAQPQYGQPQYGQPQYGQPQPGYNPYGQTPYGQPQYGYGYGTPQTPLADWGPRAGAFLLDSLITAVPVIIGYGVFIANIASRAGNTYPDDDPETWAILVFLLSIAVSFGLGLWNRVFRQGRTGQSVGKSVLNLKLVDSRSFQPIGAGKAFLREFLSGLFNNACFLNLLWPLWDDQKQTWHDKVISTYVVRD